MDEFTPTHERPRPLRTHAGIAWGFIIFFMLASMIVARLPERQPEPAVADGGVIMEVQGKTLAAGATGATANVRRVYIKQAEALNSGSVGQRQRAIVLLADIGGPEVAAERLAELDELLEEHARPEGEHPVELTEEQRRVQEVLRLLYAEEGPAVDRPRVESLDQSDRDLLVAELGWFGELALAPRKGPDRGARRALLQGPMIALVFMSLLIIGLIMLGLGGAVGLIVALVFAAQGRLGRGLAPGDAPHGIYAETFAVWFPLFLGLQIVARAVGAWLVPQHALLIVFVAFFASLTALAWPVIRGVPWSAVKCDVGLHFGRRPVVEGAIGAGGYAMALPMLAVGIVIMLILLVVHMTVRQAVGVETHPFDPDGMPAHPVFDALARPGVWTRVQLLLLAAVAAPIVEEIMFRGVLYRHLRDALRPALPGAGAMVSICGAAAITGFLFAAIHPVPWFAWPGLMALAIAFALAREWRGTIVPSVLMHAIHNGAIVAIVILILRA